MTLLQFIDYFRQYAIKHVDLRYNPADGNKGSFLGLHTEDGADDHIRNSTSPLLMMVLPYGKSLMAPKSDNYNWDKAGCFLVLKKCSNVQSDILAAQNQCEIILDDFITLMISDMHTKLTGLTRESIHAEPVGPISDGRYGYICLFQFSDNFNQLVDPDRWLP